MSSAEAVVEFLASDEALDLPDRIEEVNAKRLDAQINEKTFIAVLFRKNPLAATNGERKGRSLGA